MLPSDHGGVLAVVQKRASTSGSGDTVLSVVLEGVVSADGRVGVGGWLVNEARDFAVVVFVVVLQILVFLTVHAPQGGCHQLAPRLVFVKGCAILLVSALNPVAVNVESQQVDQLAEAFVGVGIGGEFVQGERRAAGAEVSQYPDEDNGAVGGLENKKQCTYEMQFIRSA